MSVRNTLLVAFAVVGMTLAAGCASQSNPAPGPAEMPEMTPEEMMAAYAEKNATNEHHARLARMAGTWSVAGKSWMTPGEPPMETQGTATLTPVLDGRYLAQEYSADFMGMPYRGRGIEGYDNARQQYFSVWIDNMSTGAMHSWGDYDAATKTTTYTADHENPVTGATEKMRMTGTEKGPNEFLFTMYMVMPDGSEEKHMELTYTR